jgi:hypothetical protein
MYSDFQNLINDAVTYKNRTDSLAQFFWGDWLLGSLASKMIDCGTFLSVGTANDVGCKVYNANFCRLRLCPMCQRRRALKVYGQMLRVSSDLAEEYSALHLVLSRPNVAADALEKELSWLFASSSTYFRDKQIKRAFKGILRCCEVTYNPMRDDYHPHLHCLVFVNKSYFTSRDYLKRETLSQKWDRLTGVEGSGCYISRVKDIEKGVAEVCKYAVKPFEIADNIDVWRTIYLALHNRRMVQSYGIVKQKLRELGQDLEQIDTEIVENPVYLHWNGAYYDYSK